MIFEFLFLDLRETMADLERVSAILAPGHRRWLDCANGDTWVALRLGRNGYGQNAAMSHKRRVAEFKQCK